MKKVLHGLKDIRKKKVQEVGKKRKSSEESREDDGQKKA